MKVLAILVLTFVASEALPPLIPYEEYVRNGGLPLPEPLREPLVAFNNSRIVGGELAVAGEGKWTVSLRSTASGSHTCGGSIYNAKTIITAAHCVYGSTKRYIRYNTLDQTTGGTIVESDKVIWHSGYSSSTFDNDIAVITLLDTLTLGQQQADSVKLPDKNSDPTDGTSTTCYGWGHTQENGINERYLRKVTVPIVERETCRTQYGTSSITNNMICAGIEAGGKDACQNDSGGPLTDDQNRLVGVVSWGNGCARPEFSGVYVRTANYIDWIIANSAN